uniref:Uncharacterized protein n=1 Tax=Periophthalmus magnuspinnatus TaxID=409849 RepID=A0A3B3ZQ77_9GOBI
MQASNRKRHAAAFLARFVLAVVSEVDVLPQFHLDLWTLFLLQSWTLDLARPIVMVDIFELLGYYDDTVGHVMWSVPYFLVLFLYFGGCFCHKKQQQKMPRAAWILMLPNALYIWFVVTERQTFILFLFTCFAMVATVMQQRRRGFDNMSLKYNLILHSFSIALLLVIPWSSCWWRDEVLRRKHRGLLFIPQPRTVFSLHFQKLMF